MQQLFGQRSWFRVGGISRFTLAGSFVACSAFVAGSTSIGCNAFDEAPGSNTRTVRVIPTDERPVESSSMPLAVSGGTLLSLGQAESLAAADPDREQITVTALDANGSPTTKTLSLPKGSEPGRMVMIGATQFAAALRGSGQVIAVNATDATTAWQTQVCNAPRGVDFELASNQIHVACAEGTLVSLDAANGEVITRTELEPDLRDVIAKDGRLYVSRFRAAEVLFVENGAITQRVELPTVNVVDEFTGTVRAMKPAVAWRMQSNPLGGVAVVHQRATIDEVPIDGADVEEEGQSNGGNASPYGGVAGGCGGIVQVAVTQVQPSGERMTTGSLSGVTLPVDFAFSPDGSTFAVADAGVRDTGSPLPETRTLVAGGGTLTQNTAGVLESGVSRFDSAQLVNVDAVADGSDFPSVTCSGAVSFEQVTGPVTALVFDGNTVVAQDQRMNVLVASNGARPQQQLPGEVFINTGHELFHRNSGGGLACASCHPEGTSDGHVWTFKDLGERRTQDLAIPLADTEPFHWDGELADVSAIMDEVFVERMGGVFESKERLEVLANWLGKAPKSVRTVTEMSEAAVRGKELFESSETGCATCHSGEAFTDNRSYFVGTGTQKFELQVPSLIGIAARPPFMHDGCAKTLLERFDPECGGGDMHGKTSQLSSAELDDLVAYLRTL